MGLPFSKEFQAHRRKAAAEGGLIDEVEKPAVVVFSIDKGDPISGYCPQTKIFQSLRPLPTPPSSPLSPPHHFSSMPPSVAALPTPPSSTRFIFAFFNNPTATAYVGSISQPTQPPPPPQNPTHTTMFDSLSNYLQHQNPSSIFNPNMIWSKTLRFEQNSTDIINHILSAYPFMNSFSTGQSPTVSAPTVSTAVSRLFDDHIYGKERKMSDCLGCQWVREDEVGLVF
ncbi:Uncharacterized protein Fot_03845 [Forsythia ovata]|uniref:Uncharacterized protein n=1 Tax=Forsythia ovata TaxID=205694 RepID=A0ABD1XAV2_9LAMI